MPKNVSFANLNKMPVVQYKLMLAAEFGDWSDIPFAFSIDKIRLKSVLPQILKKEAEQVGGIWAWNVCVARCPIYLYKAPNIRF